MKLRYILLIVFLFGFLWINAQTVESYSTFHCISLYWKPVDGAADNECKVKYRIEGDTEWREGMSLWFDPNDNDVFPERSQEYRGSLVDLIPGTKYEIELELQKTKRTVSLTQSTLSESFKIMKTVKLDSGTFNEPLDIYAGGSRFEGYVLYDASEVKHIIDVEKLYNYCVRINASYVIIRGLEIKGAKRHGVELGIVDNVVIEECDISDWGTEEESGEYKGFGININSGIYSGNSGPVSNIVIQRNKIHHPSTDANSWEEPEPSTHPHGPQGISLSKPAGQIIIRYNEIFSDKDHKFNDGMGGLSGNFSYSGFPNRDSDIYCNLVSDCWDDAIEAEGSGMNVRIWGNFVDTTYVAFGLATQSLGPLYVFRNIANFSQRAPYPINKFDRGGTLFKIGAEPTNYKFARGRMILFHNVSLQPKTPWSSGEDYAGVESGLSYSSGTKVQENILSRNNIIQVKSHSKNSINDPNKNQTNDFDYDFYNGIIKAVSGSETNGFKGTPIYDPLNKKNEYFLAYSAPGHNDGVIIPNFNGSYVDDGPDMGAFERGLPPIKFGVTADWNEWVEAVNPNSTSATGHSLFKNTDMNKLFILYPNPATEILKIKFLYNKDFINLTIYDCNGRKIYFDRNFTSNDNSTLINLSNWVKGMYFVEAVSENTVQTSRVIIN